jgi:hypothetical protein
MVRERVSHWSRDRSPEDAALALLAIGLVPETLRSSESTEAQVLSAVREVLAVDGQPAHWRLNAAHGHAEGWESVVAVEDLAKLVREALPHARAVHIECGDALDPEDVLDFFDKEPESAALRSNGWTFTMICDDL